MLPISEIVTILAVNFALCVAVFVALWLVASAIRDVSFIDSLSLSALVGARRRLGEDGRLAVVAVHEYVRLILQATGLEQVLDVFDTRDEAVAFVQQ